MFRFRKPEIEDFRADYAKRADFCEIFEKDMKRLYLLGLLVDRRPQANRALLCVDGRGRFQRTGRV
jgi:hypothetical protein